MKFFTKSFYFLFLNAILISLLNKKLGSIVCLKMGSRFTNLSFTEFLKVTEGNRFFEKELIREVDKNLYKVYIIHQGNKIMEEGKTLRFLINMDEKTGNLVFKAKNSERAVPLSELIFMDEKITFSIQELQAIKTEVYKQFINSNFLPAIRKVMEYDANIEQYGFVIFHHKYGKKKDTKVELDLAIIFSPTDDSITEDSAKTLMDELKNNLEGRYTEVIKSWDEITWNIPAIMEKSDNYFLYWNNLDGFKETISYYTSIADEGVVLNELSNRTPHTAKYAFRYDQVFECDGVKKITKIVSSKKIKQSLPIASCCVGYNVNWYDKPAKELFCSKSKISKTCEMEISLFKKIVFKKCTDAAVGYFGREMESGKKLEELPLLNKIRLKLLLDRIKKHNLVPKIDASHKLKKYYDLIGQNFDKLLQQATDMLKGTNIDEILMNKQSKGKEDSKKSKSNPADKHSTNKADLNKKSDKDNASEKKNEKKNENNKDTPLDTDSIGKEVVKAIEKGLGKELDKSDAETVMQMMKPFGPLFKNILDKKLPIPYDILRMYKEKGKEPTEEMLKKMIAGDTAVVKKDVPLVNSVGSDDTNKSQNDKNGSSKTDSQVGDKNNNKENKSIDQSEKSGKKTDFKDNKNGNTDKNSSTTKDKTKDNNISNSDKSKNANSDSTNSGDKNSEKKTSIDEKSGDKNGKGNPESKNKENKDSNANIKMPGKSDIDTSSQSHNHISLPIDGNSEFSLDDDIFNDLGKDCNNKKPSPLNTLGDSSNKEGESAPVKDKALNLPNDFKKASTEEPKKDEAQPSKQPANNPDCKVQELEKPVVEKSSNCAGPNCPVIDNDDQTKLRSTREKVNSSNNLSEDDSAWMDIA